MISTIIILVTVFFICYAIFKKDQKPILGLYQKPGKWFWIKYILMRGFLLLRKRRIARNKGFSGEVTRTQFFTKLSTPEELEKPQTLSQLPQAFDAVFFIAASKEGHFITCGSERRHYGISHSPLYIVIPGKGIYCHLKIPDTILFGAEENQYGAEGLRIEVLEPMRRWKITFRGKMKNYKNPREIIDVDLEAKYYSTIPFFNFDTDTSTHAIARATALEEWSFTYFENLKRFHQTHYEQMGYVDAKISIDGKLIELEKMDTFRDHSFGLQRDWDLMHRYAMFMIFLDNGFKSTIIVICHPCTQSELHLGYVVLPEGEVQPLEWTDFKLYQHGETGVQHPKEFAFQFKAGGKVYTLQGIVNDEVEHFVGWRWQARMVHKYMSYDIDGLKGRGLCEYNYSNREGRPMQYTENDPEWFKKIEK